MAKESRNLELVLSQGKELIEFYRKNPCIAAYELLGVDLAPIQQLVFEDMWFKNYMIAVCGRGAGKTYMLGALAALSCMLYPGYRVGLIAPVFRQSLPIFPTNSSSCATFWSTSGMTTGVENMYNNVVPDITQVQSLNSQNTILSKWKNDERACINIKTTKGFELSGSIDHSVLVLNKDFDLTFKELQDIKDNYIAIKHGFNYFGNNDSMPKFDEFEHNWRTKDCEIPKELTLDLAYWMGLMVGDGCISISKDERKQRVDFVSEDQDLLDSFEEYLRKYFLIDKDEKISRDNRKNNTWEIEYYCKKLTHYLLKCGFTKTTALDKKIPDVLKKASREMLIAFLQGLMDTDGGVYIQKGFGCSVAFSTSSIQLAKEVQAVLLNLGIISNLGISKKACIRKLPQGNKPSKCAEAYKVRITGQVFLKKFDEIIGFRCKRKNEMLTDYLNTHFENKASLSMIVGLPQGMISRNIDKVKEFAEQGLYFVKMVDKDYFFAPTVDIEVENESCYWANGFINHNSKMIFSEVEKLWSESPILREATEKRPIRGTDTCYLKFKSVAGSPGSFIESLPLGDGCLSNDYGYLTYFDRFGKIGDAHDPNIQQNHYIDRKEIIWGNGEFRESDRSLCNGIKKTIKIKTAKGFKSEGTPNHRFKVVRNNQVVWCCFDEMVVGDRILIDRSKRWHNGSSEVTKEQAFSFGFLIGDGCWTDCSSRLSFATKDRELLPILLHGIGCDYFYESTDDAHYVACSSKSYITQNDVRKDWMDFWGIDSTYALNKKFPKKILSTSREIMTECIKGVFAADGNVQVSTAKGGVSITVALTNTSEELIDQIQYILLHYGIVACKLERDRNENWNTIYELIITGKDAKIFYEEIGFGLERKDNILKAAVEAKTRWVSYEDVPVDRDVMIDISNNNRVKKGKGCKKSRCCKASTLKKKKYITPYLIDCFLETHGSLNDDRLDAITKLNNPDIYYDEIVSISDGEALTYDTHVPVGNEYCANGFFSHNSKIRGSRFYLILIDELAQIPDDVLDLVIRPMGATSMRPMEKVRRLKRQNQLIDLGLATSDDFEDETINKMIMTSSGYYKFNHMWRRMKSYWKAISEADRKGESSQYSVWQVPYWDLPEGFLDMNNIEEAKRVMSRHEFSMEYEAAMISDSEGFFKASLLEDCTLNSGFNLELQGDRDGQYIIGVDPNQGGAASCGVVVIRMGKDKHRIVNVLELKRQTTQDMTTSIQALCEQYNVIRIFMDKGGGGKAICDLLEEGYGGVEPIIDRTNEDHLHLKGRHILEMVVFNPSWIADANYSTLALLEGKKLLFPETPIRSIIDLEGAAYENIQNLKSQMLNIIITQTPSGLLHFDTPSKGQNKDLYSALILAAHGVGLVERELDIDDAPVLYNEGGMIRFRQSGASWNSLSRGNSNFIQNKKSISGLGLAILEKKIK